MGAAVLLQLLRSPPAQWPHVSSGELPRIMTWIDAHRIGPWLYRRLLTEGGASALQSPWYEPFKSRYTLSLMQTRLDDGVREEVLGALSAEGIPVMPLKGAVLGPWLYGEPCLRPSNDLDVLVAPEDYGVAERVLAGLGYRPASRKQSPWLERSSHEKGFSRGEDLPVELHRHVTQVRRFPLAMGDILARSIPWTWREISLQRMAVEDQFLTLVIHAAHHQFRMPIMSWIDLGLLLDRGVDLELVGVRAGRCGAMTALRVAAELLDRLLGRRELLSVASPIPGPRRYFLREVREDGPSLEQSRGPLRDRWYAFWLIQRKRDGTLFALNYACRWVLDRPFAWSLHSRTREPAVPLQYHAHISPGNKVTAAAGHAAAQTALRNVAGRTGSAGKASRHIQTMIDDDS